ncbi:LytR/AlgR family response regulator transcription factor [Pseudoxanthomonas wuyuanensis]|uniref:Two component transcriptional regulator, LytTR family n=1 Tax=Pseudoxanthomonas wuyuanensis TaxID=1073196 RepID=A0A286D307_9GAMM|nr:LytTR family DNA-binding domain-containing protein [Pseudoxanthomonas wuyuanensis]KAF1723039.1 DNA-binding response regulator [Pseudoxanthomonas wuyuanensis]SOD53019.1 two component transcriptional regulator, LytTR family [Pseudoxanthomonas wuyuanensis]
MNRPLRAVIADDEPLARARLQRLLGQMDAVQVVAQCASARETIGALRSTAADVVFLDIRMPDADGFDVLQALPGARPQIVFVTAYAEHAVHAFDEDAADYLLKPFSADRLHAALERVRNRVRAPELAASAVPPRTDYAARLAVSVGRRTRVIMVEELSWARAQANYVELHVGGRDYLLRGTIAELAERLDPSRFVRVHRSALVRIDAVDSLESGGGGQYLLHLREGAVLRTGRSYRQVVRSAFGLA